MDEAFSPIFHDLQYYIYDQTIPYLKKIQFIGDKWFLEIGENTNESYTHAAILIHNPIFQLIEFKIKAVKTHSYFQ